MSLGLVIGLVVVLLSLIVTHNLKKKFLKYSKIKLRANLSGAQVAATMLQDNGIEGVKIMSSKGHLNDHYNPITKTVNLSEQVYYGKNATAAAIAAHECGHAIQQATSYPFIKVRSAMVPLVAVSATYMSWIILIGIFVINITPIPLTVGIAFFAFTTLFSFITLPIEFDASKRALVWMHHKGIVTSQEHTMAQDALRWAAMTYVVAALGSLAQLLYLIPMLANRRN